MPCQSVKKKKRGEGQHKDLVKRKNVREYIH